MALVGLAGAVGLTIFYVYQGERIAQSGAQELVTRIVQILIALACAAFLFGTMKSTGIITSKEIGKRYTFGGPAALFIAVLAILIAKGPTGDTFDLTVRPHGAEGSDAIISSGQITIDLGNDRRSKAINSNGEADFKGIPAKFKGATVGVLAQVDGYKQTWQQLQVKDDVLDVELQPAPPPITRLTGSIVPPPKDWAKLRLMIDGQSVEGKVDQLGRFNFQVNGKNGDTIRLKVYDGTKLLYDDFQTPPGPLTLTLHSK